MDSLREGGGMLNCWSPGKWGTQEGQGVKIRGRHVDEEAY